MSSVFNHPAMPDSSGVRAATATGTRRFWKGPALLAITAFTVVASSLLIVRSQELSVGLVCVGLLALAAIMARTMKISASSSRSKQAASGPARQTTWPDEQALAANRMALMEAGDRLIAQSRRNKKPLSVIVFDQGDLPELHSIYGREIAERCSGKLAEALRAMATPLGQVFRTEASVFTVLLPGLGSDRAQAAVRQALGSTCSIEFDADDDEIVVLPDFLVQTVRSDTPAMSRLYWAMRREIEQAQLNERNRVLYLRRERESYASRAMALDPDRSPPARHEMTMPAPLAAR